MTTRSGRAGSPRPAPRCAPGTSRLQRHRQVQHVGRGAWRRPSAASAPGRRTRRGASPAATGPAWPAIPAPAARTGPRAPARRSPGPAGPAAWSTTWRSAGLADQRVPEQADRAGPFGPHPFFVMAERHLLLLRARGNGIRVARVVDQTAPPKGRLVLIDTAVSPGASSRPPVTADASCHGDTAPTTPSRRRAAAAHAADRLDRVGEHARMDRQRAGQRVELHQQRREQPTAPPRRCRRTRAASPAPSRPAGPAAPAIGRCPAPAAFARSAAPITSTPSARRSRHDTASSTCVTKQVPHRARRGRRPPTPRTDRCRACPHGARPPPHGQASSPARRRRSTSSDIATYHDHGCLHQHQATALPSGQGMGRAVALSRT